MVPYAYEMRFDSALCRLNLSGDVAAAATLGRVDLYGAEKSDKSYEWNIIFRMFKAIFCLGKNNLTRFRYLKMLTRKVGT